MKNPQIYFDHASTTYTVPEVVEAMLPYFTEKYGNPHSNHTAGLEAKQAIDQSRETVARHLNCSPSEIIFCGSATEANNLCLKGFARANKNKGNHIITCNIEHKSVLNPLKYLKKNEGFKITFLQVDNDGLVNPDDLEKAITDETILVSIMYANNEIGTVQPIKKLGEICKKHAIPFHTDACQAAGALNLNTQEQNIDLMSFSSSKFYGPKGIGILFKKQNLDIKPIIHGGGQEFGLRSGTHNTAYIVGLAKALQLAQENSGQENARLIKLRDYLIESLLKKIPGIKLNGHKEKRLPNNINISIPDIDGAELLLHLDAIGIYASTGSACSAKKTAPSHVLLAIDLPENMANSSLRLTLGKSISEKEINYLLEKLPPIIEKLQKN